MATRQMDRMIDDAAWLTYPLHVFVGIIKMFVYTFLAFLLFVFIFFLWMFTAHDQRAELTKDFITQQTVFRVDPLSNAVTVQKPGTKIVCGRILDGVNRAFDEHEIIPDSQLIYGRDVNYNRIIVGGKLKSWCYAPNPVSATTVAKAFGGASDNGSFIKNPGWFDHQWLAEKSDAFDFAYIKAARSLNALQTKLYEVDSQNVVIPNDPVVYVSFLDFTDRDYLFPAAEFRGNWYTGMCSVNAKCTDADFVPRNDSIFYDAVAPQMTDNQDAAVKGLYATGTPEFWVAAAHANGIYNMDAEFANAAKYNQSAMAAGLAFSEPPTDEFVREVMFGVGLYVALVALLCACFTRRTHKFNHSCENS